MTYLQSLNREIFKPEPPGILEGNGEASKAVKLLVIAS
jgi:hypothetical protein